MTECTCHPLPPRCRQGAEREWSGGFLSAFKAQLRLDVDEARGLGEWTFERGDYVNRLRPVAGGSSMGDSGKYYTIYRPIDGTGWKIVRKIWNSGNPLPV